MAGLVTADAARRIVLSSGPSDRTAADRIAAAARQILGTPLAAHVLDFGDIDLAELRALIERSGLFVGGDTGPLHIAATTRTPIVGIYGPTLAARSAPWRDPALATEVGRRRRPAVPAVRAAGVRAWRLPVPDGNRS